MLDNFSIILVELQRMGNKHYYFYFSVNQCKLIIIENKQIYYMILEY